MAIKMKKCQFCSGEIRIDEEKCIHCGEFLDRTEISELIAIIKSARGK